MPAPHKHRPEDIESPELLTLSKLRSVADTIPFFAARGRAELTAITSFSRGVIGAETAADFRTAIGAGTSSVALPIAESDVTGLVADLADKADITYVDDEVAAVAAA